MNAPSSSDRAPLIDAATLLTGDLPHVALDATVLMPGETGDPDAAFLHARIPGARRFDIDIFADPESPLSHTVPGAARFARLMGTLGLTEKTPIVFYDRDGSVGACRGWWLARLFGHENARVLDGGLAAWIAAGGGVQSGAVGHWPPGTYRVRPRYGLLAGIGDVQEAVRRGHRIVLDARNAGRFAGQVPEPRPGVRSGHMPGAINLEWKRLLDAEGRFLPPDALRALFADVKGREVIASCGSGLTAATLLVGLEIAGLPGGALYDGSWAEWGADRSVPVESESGEAETV